MASGNVVGLLSQITQPGTVYATFDTRVGGSTPAETRQVYDFDDTQDEYLDFYGVLEGYAGGGLTLTFDFSMTSATSGNVRLGAAIRRFDTAEDHDGSHAYDFNEVTVAVSGTAGARVRATITFTDGADMDSLANGEPFILRLRREPTDTTNDTATGDMELWPETVLVKET